jgi:hypothetical protein
MTQPPQKEKWPNPVVQFWWDLLPDKWAPKNSGVIAPAYVEPAWLSQPVAEEEVVVDVTRQAREEAERRAATAEDKANRLVQVALALLAIAITVGGYQLGYVRKHAVWYYWFLLLPAACAVVFLAWATIIALEIDRPGVYHQPIGVDLAPGPVSVRSRVQAEEKGRQLADWSARHKVSTLLNARSRLSRGLVSLTIAALVAAFTVAAGDPFPVPSSKVSPPHHHRANPSVTSSPAP